MFNKKRKYKLFKRKSKFQKFYYKNKEFIDYNIVSFVCTIILYLVFFIVDLITSGNYLLANLFSYVISFAVLYILDKEVFKSKPKRKRDRLKMLTTFIIVRIIGFPLDSLVLHTLIAKFNMGNMLAKVVGSVIMFIYNYFTNKLFVFNKTEI